MWCGDGEEGRCGVEIGRRQGCGLSGAVMERRGCEL